MARIAVLRPLECGRVGSASDASPEARRTLPRTRDRSSTASGAVRRYRSRRARRRGGSDFYLVLAAISKRSTHDDGSAGTREGPRTHRHAVSRCCSGRKGRQLLVRRTSGRRKVGSLLDGARNKFDLVCLDSEADACFQLLGRLAYTQLAAKIIGRLDTRAGRVKPFEMIRCAGGVVVGSL